MAVVARKAKPGETFARKATPEEVRDIEDGGFVESFTNIPRQFLAGIGDVTGLFARPFEMAFGTVEFTNEGFKRRSPEDVDRLLAEGGRRGIPGQATEEPTNIAGRAARFSGQTATLGPIVGRAATLAKAPVIPGGGKMAGQMTRAINEMGKRFAAQPGLVVAEDIGFGSLAGGGGFIAEKLFPDSDVAVLIGELLTPSILAVSPVVLTVQALGGVRSIVDKIRHPFSLKGGTERAAARAQRSATLEQREKGLVELDESTTIDPLFGKPVLTPGQRTEIPGLQDTVCDPAPVSDGVSRKSGRCCDVLNSYAVRGYREI